MQRSDLRPTEPLWSPSVPKKGLANITEMAATLGVPTDDLKRLWSETFSDRETGVFRTIEENIQHVCQRLGIQRDDPQVTAAAKDPRTAHEEAHYP